MGEILASNVGAVLILVSASGYLSNWLNWRYLNYRITHLLYYIGAFVHESSHALLCILMRAPIREYAVFTNEPHVIHGESRVPVIGKLFISIAPLAGGLLFLFLINAYVLESYFTIPHVAGFTGIASAAWALVSQLNPLAWQSWVMLLLFVNMGAMIGPSAQDLKNIWPLVLLLCLVQEPTIAAAGLFAVTLIIINILIQLALIVSIWFASYVITSPRET